MQPAKLTRMNERRPKAARNFDLAAPGFVLDYNRSRETQQRYRGRGRPFYDKAEVRRRQLRSRWRPPPLTSVPPGTQGSTQSRSPPPPPPGPPPGGPPRGGPGGPKGPPPDSKGAPPGPKGPPPDSKGAPPGPKRAPRPNPFGSGMGLGSKTSKSSVRAPSGIHHGSPAFPPMLPEVSYKEVLKKGKSHFGWALSLACIAMKMIDIEFQQVYTFLKDFWPIMHGQLTNFTTNYLRNPEFDDMRSGTTGHFRWWFANYVENRDPRRRQPFVACTDLDHTEARWQRITVEGNEEIIKAATELGEDRGYIEKGTKKNGPEAIRILSLYDNKAEKAATLAEYISLGMRGLATALTSIPDDDPSSKSQAQPSKVTTLDARVEQMMKAHEYLWTEAKPRYPEPELLRNLIRSKFEKGEAIVLPPPRGSRAPAPKLTGTSQPQPGMTQAIPAPAPKTRKSTISLSSTGVPGVQSLLGGEWQPRPLAASTQALISALGGEADKPPTTSTTLKAPNTESLSTVTTSQTPATELPSTAAATTASLLDRIFNYSSWSGPSRPLKSPEQKKIQKHRNDLSSSAVLEPATKPKGGLQSPKPMNPFSAKVTPTTESAPTATTAGAILDAIGGVLGGSKTEAPLPPK